MCVLEQKEQSIAHNSKSTACCCHRLRTGTLRMLQDTNTCFFAIYFGYFYSCSVLKEAISQVAFEQNVQVAQTRHPDTLGEYSDCLFQRLMRET